MGIRNFRNMGILEIQQLVSQGYLRLIKDKTVSVATTSVTIDTDENSQAFSFGKDSTLMLVSDINNTSGTGSVIRVYANNNQTPSNYYRQTLNAINTAISSERVNDPTYTFVATSTKNLSMLDIKLTNDGYYTVKNSNNRAYGGSNIILSNFNISSTFTATTLTRFDIVASVTNAIGVGSRFMLFEVIQ